MTPYEEIQKIVAHHISDDVRGYEITIHTAGGTSYHYFRSKEPSPQPHIGDGAEPETDPDMETPAPAGPLGYHDEDFG